MLINKKIILKTIININMMSSMKKYKFVLIWHVWIVICTNIMWSKGYDHFMIQRMWMCHNQKCAYRSWPEMCKWVVTENVQTGHDRKATYGLWPKGCEWIMTERVWRCRKHDQKGANRLWPKWCKWS